MDINIIATYRNKNSSEELLSLAEKSSNIELLELDVSSNQFIEQQNKYTFSINPKFAISAYDIMSLQPES